MEGLPQKVPGKSCIYIYSAATFSVRQQVALAEWVLPKFIDEKTMVGFSHVCGMMCAVCFIVFLKSVSPVRPWPRPWKRTPL